MLKTRQFRDIEEVLDGVDKELATHLPLPLSSLYSIHKDYPRTHSRLLTVISKQSSNGGNNDIID